MLTCFCSSSFRIMADTTIRLAHFGSYPYSWEDAGGEMKRFDTYNYRVIDPAAQKRPGPKKRG